MKPLITVIVIFYNNKREAPRTLHTLSSGYQRGVDTGQYQVLAIDNASSERLNPKMVKSYGENFDYLYFKTDSISPCAALNEGIKKAKTPYVMCIIDGAHMLSPGVLQYTLSALKTSENPFVYTVPLHLGGEFQNYAIHSGYNQKEEDKLLQSVAWKTNGYELFQVSNLTNSRYSFSSKLAESNCFTIKKKTLQQVGGFDERFVSSGGGMVNLHTFKKLITLPDISPVALCGEATFHQFHGGVSTNIPNKDHPLLTYKAEYEKVGGEAYSPPDYEPQVWGHFPAECREFMPITTAKSLIKMAEFLRQNGKLNEALALAEYLLLKQPNTDTAHALVGFVLQEKGNHKRALKHYQEAISLNPLAPVSIGYYLNAGRLLHAAGESDAAIRCLQKAGLIHPDQPEILLETAQLLIGQNEQEKGEEYLAEAIRSYKEKPGKGYLANALINFLLQHKKVQQAAEIVEIGEKIYEDNPQFYALSGRVYNQLGKSDKVEASFRKALALGHKNPYNIYKMLGNLYHREARPNDAVLAFHHALEHKPADKELAERLTKLRRQLMKQVKADAHKSFIFMHIPKCGGMSMRKYIYDVGLYSGFAPSEMHTPKYNDYFPNKNLVQMAWDELGLLKDNKIKILADHTEYNAHKNYSLLSMKEPFYFTILREPIARTISHYYYMYYERGQEGLRRVHINDLDLEQLDRICYTTANQQVVYLAEMGVNEGYRAKQSDLEIAMDVLENQMPCFGILEKMEESIARLQAKSPAWLKYNQAFPKLNTGTKKKKETGLSPEAKKILLKYNELDIKLYEFAVKLFERRTMNEEL